MLNKKESNNIIKSIKMITFATGISLLNPINVSAQELCETEVIEDSSINPDIVLKFSLGSIILVGTGLYAKLIIDMKKNPFVPKTGIKLGDNKTNKQLKLINSREVKHE